MSIALANETLLREKTLLRKLALQPADESVPKSFIEEVTKFAEGRCLPELSYILCYRLQRFLVPAMEMELLFNHQRLWLECAFKAAKRSPRNFSCGFCGASKFLRGSYVVAPTTLRKTATCFTFAISFAWKKRDTCSRCAEPGSWPAWYSSCSCPKRDICIPRSSPVVMS